MTLNQPLFPDAHLPYIWTENNFSCRDRSTSPYPLYAHSPAILTGIFRIKPLWKGFLGSRFSSFSGRHLIIGKDLVECVKAKANEYTNAHAKFSLGVAH